MNARIIEHQQAIQDMTAERYLLGELTESDLESFERHLFDCSACFEQVRAGTEFVNYIKRIGAVEPVPDPTQPRWHGLLGRALRPAPALVFAAMFLGLASLGVYQTIALHRMSEPRIVVGETLHSDSRGGGPLKTVTVSSNGVFELHVVGLRSSPELSGYQALVKNSKEKIIGSAVINEPVKSEIEIVLHAQKFRSGNYTLEIVATRQATGKMETINIYPFELKLQD